MAKSKLIGSRTQKKATILASMQTVKDAIRRAQLLGETWFAANQSDPRVEELQRIVTHLSSILKKTPQQMRADGVTSVEDYFDDAKSQQVAQTIKREVNMIAKMHDEQRGQSAQPAKPTPQERGVGYVPNSAVAEQGIHASVKEANGGGFTTDRDEQGEAKAPEVVGVPRLAKKKKKEAEEPAPVAPVAPPTDQVPEAPLPAPAAPAPVAAPAPAAGNGKVNPIEYIPTETLVKVIGDLPKEDDFAQNKNKQDALVALTEILKTRPILPPDPVEGQAAAPAMPVAASKKADYGDHAMGGNGTIGEGSGASATVGAGGNISTDGVNPAPAKANTGVDLGGLSIASSLEEDKTADDYRIHDYKLQDEGLVPSGRLPNMDEQEAQMQPEGEFEKESEAPPHSENVVHALKDSDVDNPFAVAWSMHNKGDKMSAVKSAIAAVHSILASGAAGSWFVGSGEPADMTE